MQNPIPTLRKLALTEAVSFLLLMGVAMPLKYLAGYPLAVTIVGWAHGILFVAFGISLAWTWWITGWSWTRVAALFIAALIPFGPFLIDRRMLGWEAEYLAKARSDAGS